MFRYIGLSLLFGGYLFAHRNPNRTPDSKYGIISPADGKIISIDNRTIKIFLGLTDVHYQRAPLSGVVKSINLKEGNTGFCYVDTGCPEHNKFISTIIMTKYGYIEIIQKAGGLFSKPVSFLTVGQYIERGSVIGKITFGSGCSITIPREFKINIKENQKVLAGQTIIAL